MISKCHFNLMPVLLVYILCILGCRPQGDSVIRQNPKEPVSKEPNLIDSHDQLEPNLGHTIVVQGTTEQTKGFSWLVTSFDSLDVILPSGDWPNDWLGKEVRVIGILRYIEGETTPSPSPDMPAAQMPSGYPKKLYYITNPQCFLIEKD